MLIEVIVATIGGTVTAVSLGGIWLAKRLRESDLAEENAEREHELKMEREHREPEEIAAELKEKEIEARVTIERERLAAEEKEKKRKTAEAKEEREREEGRQERERRQTLPEISTPKNRDGQAVCPYCNYITHVEKSPPNTTPLGSYWYEQIVEQRRPIGKVKAEVSHRGPCSIHIHVADDGTQLPWRMCTSCGAEWIEKLEYEESLPRKKNP